MSEQVSAPEASPPGEPAVSKSVKPFPEQLFEAGFRDVVSVIPPGAELAPLSKISQASIGKAPGRRNAQGLWGGYDWRHHEPTIDDVRRWVFQGANIGLRAARFPGVDIDCTDAGLAQLIEDVVCEQLGAAPTRIGRAPKRLLMYRTDEPFSRMRLNIKTPEGGSHLVEILGDGQQYLVHGTHPSGKAYQWLQDPTSTQLTTITRQQASDCLDTIQQRIESVGAGIVDREGDGRRQARTAAQDQDSLLAPSIDALRECVAMIPNSNELFPDRTDYIRIGYAIKAAAGMAHEEDGFDIFADWADRWDGGVNAPDMVRDDWGRMSGAKSVGWSFLAERAREFGFNDAAYEFDVVADAPPPPTEKGAPRDSDQWLAQQIVAAQNSKLRYVPQKGTWLVWDDSRWRVDANLEANDLIKRGLKDIASTVMRREPKIARRVCSAGTLRAVAQLMTSDRAMAVLMDSLDHDPWILNTPGGAVDLKTGELRPCDPRDLCTRATAVAPDFMSACPTWTAFLQETTRGDAELVAYHQRHGGYCLTGSTREHQLQFLWGPGGNGKSVYLNTLSGILGDYACTAAMETFIATSNDRHPTELAMLAGARLVAASETSANRSWDDARLKSLTGGDPISARFMRQDFFKYTPQFKLIIVGNHKPGLKTVDDAIRRRLHMVSFTNKPTVVDHDLSDKLKAEWPAILAWMIRGCLDWQREGLNPPAAITATTTEYLADQDLLGRWLRERCELVDGQWTPLQDLYESFREWANASGESPGISRAFGQDLTNHGFARRQHPSTRRVEYQGIAPVQSVDFALPVG